MPLAMLAKPQN